VTDGRLSGFSLAGFAVAIITVGTGAAAGLALVPTVGSYLGMLLGASVAGLAVEDHPLVEGGVAAALAGLGILAAGSLVGNGPIAALSTLASLPPTTLLTTTVLSFAVGAFGAHFGDDLRDGLTTPVETPPTGRTTPGTPPVPSDDGQRADESVAETEPERAAGREPEQPDTGEGSTGPESERDRNLELERE
jgi:hypothetical protein